jgi:hypothetical protein
VQNFQEDIPMIKMEKCTKTDNLLMKSNKNILNSSLRQKKPKPLVSKRLLNGPGIKQVARKLKTA